jgi:putative ABC transport system ATP-binding protein
MPEPLIQVKNLKKEFVLDELITKVLHGLSFIIDEGEFVAIMGPSGSGKSTLMHIIGFLDTPTEGHYLYRGKDVAKFNEDTLAILRNKEVGFVFQSFNLLPKTSVAENVKLPLIYDGGVDKQKAVDEAIAAVGLTHRASYLPNQISGGEKQRAAIARALVNQPKLVFADEPTGNLDSKSGEQIMRILQKLNDEGKTVILVTHEKYTSEHAKRIIKLKDGLIVSDTAIKQRIIAKKDGELKK